MSAPGHVDAVVFDIGNVLIEWQPERFYDRLIGPERRRALFAEVDLDAMNDRIDLGEDFAGTVRATAEAHPAWRDEIRHWHDSWIEMASPAIPRSVRLLRALKARGVPVFALTNFGIGSFAHARTVYPFFDEFDLAVVSGHLGVMKPDPAIYEALERNSGVPPARLLFTDDRLANIEAAAARGWQVHHFDGPAGWADRLVASGLLDEAAAA